MIKNIILKLSILSLIAGTAFMPQPMHGMDLIDEEEGGH